MAGSNIPKETPNDRYRRGVSAIADKVKAQADKFREAAREHGTDDREEILSLAIKRVAKPLTPEEEREAREILRRLDEAAERKP